MALGLQPPPLIDAEPVLFVDHAQRQGMEGYVVLEQRMCADRDRRGAARQRGQLLGPAEAPLSRPVSSTAFMPWLASGPARVS